MNERKYFYIREGSSTPAGPHTLPELVRMKDMGELQDTTMVAASGAQEWVKLEDEIKAHAAELTATATILPPVPDKANLPAIPPAQPEVAVPETAGPCPNCGQEIPLHGKPELPEHCPHCNFLLRATNPDSLWQQFKVALKKSFVMRGRATRMEYWGFYIFCYVINMIVTMPLYVLQLLAMTPKQLSSEDELYYLEASFWSSPAGVIQIIIFGVSLVFAIPSITAAVRRLHDIGKSGWWFAAVYIAPLLSLVPLIMIVDNPHNIALPLILVLICLGATVVLGIMLLVYLFTDSQKGRNRYGASPKYPWL